MKINYNSLPYDCVARAAQRMREAYARKRMPNSKDVRTVLGDPNKCVEMLIIGESLEVMIKRFLKKKR